MNSVFLLWHSRDLGEGNSDDKLIGAYRSRASAEAAMARKRVLAGFKDYPDDFIIDEYALDHDAWSDGFVTVPLEELQASEEPVEAPRRPKY